MRSYSLLREFVAAGLVMTVVGLAVAVIFWLVTGLSPWPYVVLAEVGAFGWATTVLALSSPRPDR